IRRGRRVEAAFCGDCEDSAMSQPAKAQEPSMEEILASIRRIIADDDTAKPAAKPAPAAAPAAAAPAPAAPRPAAMPPRNPTPPRREQARQRPRRRWISRASMQ